MTGMQADVDHVDVDAEEQSRRMFHDLVDGHRDRLVQASGGKVSRQWIDGCCIGRRSINPLFFIKVVESVRNDGVVGDVVAELLGGVFVKRSEGSGRMNEAIESALGATQLFGQMIAQIAADAKDGKLDEIEALETQALRVADAVFNFVDEARALKKAAK